MKHLVANAIENNIIDDRDILEKAIDILRRTYDTDDTTPFTGSFNDNFCANKTVSEILVDFLAALMEGSKSNCKITLNIAGNIAQIIQFNTVKRRKSTASYAR